MSASDTRNDTSNAVMKLATYAGNSAQNPYPQYQVPLDGDLKIPVLLAKIQSPTKGNENSLSKTRPSQYLFGYPLQVRDAKRPLKPPSHASRPPPIEDEPTLQNPKQRKIQKPSQNEPTQAIHLHLSTPTTNHSTHHGTPPTSPPQHLHISASPTHPSTLSKNATLP